jgi:hypothetical protein
LALAGERGVHSPHRPKELLVGRKVGRGIRCRGVPPRRSQRLVGDIVPAHEPIHEVLVAGIADGDDEVVDGGREARVADQGKEKRVRLSIPVRVGEGDESVRP